MRYKLPLPVFERSLTLATMQAGSAEGRWGVAGDGKYVPAFSARSTSG